MDETTNNTNNAVAEETPNGNWAWMVTGVIILAIAIGFYYWPAKSDVNEDSETAVDSKMEATDPATASLEAVSQSDEISDIEADLNATDLSGLDQELSEIESELNQ